MDETIMSYISEQCNSSIDSLTTLTLDAKSKACDSMKCSMKFTNWLPPVEITEEVFHAIPTYVDNKCVVYLHSKKYSTLPWLYSIIYIEFLFNLEFSIDLYLYLCLYYLYRCQYNSFIYSKIIIYTLLFRFH